VERQREREREGERASVAANGLWAITLTIGQIFITARLNIILDLIKMNIKIIYMNLDGYFSLGPVLFHLTVKLLIYITLRSFTFFIVTLRFMSFC